MVIDNREYMNSYGNHSELTVKVLNRYLLRLFLISFIIYVLFVIVNLFLFVISSLFV